MATPQQSALLGVPSTTPVLVVGLSDDPNISAERRLVAGTNVTLTDTGANGTITIDVPAPGAGALAPRDALYLVLAANGTLTDERILTPGTGLVPTDSGPGGAYTLTVTLAPFSTSNLAEGANLYFTNERVDDRVAVLIQNGIGPITWTYDDGAGTLTANLPQSVATTATPTFARVFLGTDGTAAAPALAINTNSGMYRPGANALAFSIDGGQIVQFAELFDTPGRGQVYLPLGGTGLPGIASQFTSTTGFQIQTTSLEFYVSGGVAATITSGLFFFTGGQVHLGASSTPPAGINLMVTGRLLIDAPPTNGLVTAAEFTNISNVSSATKVAVVLTPDITGGTVKFIAGRLASGADGGTLDIQNTRSSGGVYASAIFINQGGNVGIGTASPTQRLDVSGGIGATTLSLSGDATLTDAVNAILGTTTGTKWATAAAQKQAWWGATPVVQGAAIADAAGGATVDAEARTAINTLLARMRTYGLIAT